MAFVIRSLYNYYQEAFYDAQDPRTIGFLLMDPPWLSFAICAVYLYFVLNLGPKLMANRKPLDLRKPLMVYNILQVIANIYLAYFGTKVMIEINLTFDCRPVDRSTSQVALREVQLVHRYYLLKLADLVDTVFFILRKKHNQVSFLHVYHHAMMVMAPFFYARNYPGGHGSLLGLANTYVHAVMYFYFFLSVWRPNWTKDLRWKKCVTIFQMIQFVAMAFWFGRPALLEYDCGIPRYWFWAGTIQSIFMFAMFADFYIKAYGVKKVNKKE
ncbi:elongation of very long chain fatty acids protein AAEL008004-like [Armigeres subalbatus]|uniref:elongation of very long chain fatty acids protein AAEL008004-like n=1 Tax=Armigeres subalbatus TaxID=124917 RepID=UPI002ED15BA6